MRHPEGHIVLSAAIALFPCISVSAADWSNSGGNPGRNCRSTETGPSAATVLWSGSRPSINAWQPVTEGNRVYMVRQTGMPPAGEPNGSPIVCQSLTTGVEQWLLDVPFNAGDATTWVGGVSHGRLYASRSRELPIVWAKLHCFDSTSGAPLWTSIDPINAEVYDGIVFAPNGDPLIGSRTNIWRIDHSTGATVWSASRMAGTTNGCGVAIGGNAVYAREFGAGGTTIRRYDLATGAFQYESAPMPGASEAVPMVGPDGTIYQNAQAAVGADRFYAWTDNGTAIVPKWNVPSGFAAFCELGVGPDGSVYHVAPNSEIHRLDPATGATIDTTGPLPVDQQLFLFPRFAIDAQGKVFLTNGQFTTGILASYDADLTLRWSVSVPSAGMGGPVLGSNGILLMAGVGTDVVAYRDLTPAVGFCFGDGSGAACPCGNAGAAGHGCASSINSAGALLRGSGIASVIFDSLVLSGSSMPNASALYFQGRSQLSGGMGIPFGDGLRCAGGAIVRLGTKINTAGASQYPGAGDPPISVRAQVPPTGGSRTYQAWYRNAASFCTPATHNLTNGVQFAWVP